MTLKTTVRFIVMFLIFPYQASSQIYGDWFLSHSYAPGYDNDFDRSQKKMERPTIMSISEDSIVSYTFEGNKLKKIQFEYLFRGDTIFFDPSGSKKDFYETSVHADTMSLIDRDRKGAYIVLRKMDRHKKAKAISEIADYVEGKTFQVNFSKMISMKRSDPNQPATYDSVQLSSNGEMIVNAQHQGHWKVFEINHEVYLLLHQFLFQIDTFNKNGLTLISYYFDAKNIVEWSISQKK